jgi:hypothetical protein
MSTLLANLVLRKLDAVHMCGSSYEHTKGTLYSRHQLQYEKGHAVSIFSQNLHQWSTA